MGILARGSTGCLTVSSPVSVARLSSDFMFPLDAPPDSARCKASGEETEPLCAVDC
jgi:hypothetical protein